ncbi:hypothetical protein V6N13_051977 [Hibiscus sabdariffa]
MGRWTVVCSGRFSHCEVDLKSKAGRCCTKEWKPGLSDVLRGQVSEGSGFGIHGVVKSKTGGMKELYQYDFLISKGSEWFRLEAFDVVSHRAFVLFYSSYNKPNSLSWSKVTVYSSYGPSYHSWSWDIQFLPKCLGQSYAHKQFAATWRRKMSTKLELWWDFTSVFLFLPGSGNNGSSELESEPESRSKEADAKMNEQPLTAVGKADLLNGKSTAKGVIVIFHSVDCTSSKISSLTLVVLIMSELLRRKAEMYHGYGRKS